MYARALKWPVISWIVVDAVLLVATLLDRSLFDMLTAGAMAPMMLAFGVWSGYKIVEFGGNYGHAIVAGIVVGVVCALLAVVGFGFISVHPSGISAVLTLGLFAFGMNLFGALIGGGFALTK